MTINCQTNGTMRVYTDRELVEEAIRIAGGPEAVTVLSQDFIQRALDDGTELVRIVSIALGREHLLPKREIPLQSFRRTA